MHHSKEFWVFWWWFMIERVVRVIWNEKWEPDLIHNIKEVTLGLEFTLIRWDDIHPFIHPSIYPSRKAKRIVQVSSLCLVENKLEGKAFIHSFTLPFIHSSIHHPSIHLEGQKTFQVPKDIGSVLRSSKAPYVAVMLQATQLPQLCKKQQYWLTQVQYSP